MSAAPLPHNEVARLKALKLLQVLDTAPEDAFDQITSTAAQIFGVPIALISLVDANRQWFKSCYGLSTSQTGRDESFCAHAILDSRPFIIPDALQDPRFCDNILVTNPPYIRFYAGVTLITPEGYGLGTLCLLDTQPRSFSEADSVRLTRLAGGVMSRLMLRLANLSLEKINLEMAQVRPVREYHL